MAKRDKLTQRQKRQVAHKQRQRIQQQTAPLAEHQLGQLSESLEGLVISRFGEQADIMNLCDQKVFRCYLRQNLGSIVSGDKVVFRLAENEQGIVEARHSRDSVFERPSAHQGLKAVVANINQVFIVAAPLPDFSAALLDRYLVAIEDANNQCDIPLKIIILLNKWDLQSEIIDQSIEEQLTIYRQLDYPIIKVSTKTGLGIDLLKQHAVHQQSILVGQSGVGKSSIINHLFPQQESLVNQVSQNSRLGQHTTTTSQLFLVKEMTTTENSVDGFIIDSPGIREFGLWHMDSHKVAAGFKEFLPFIGACKFRDCQHINEPGCAILQAVDTKQIALQRWQNYCKIVSSPAS
ncbi:small ribosomal subunit biogenesis GTPase RsgA [Aliikangiella maris]|uniref:Small ribosomal subunit biogenesis GTPase RsgA n=2 Tax=Aliikangiella maris TaxID=3162458 RepID=A0ABV3MQ48_9GAMM